MMFFFFFLKNIARKSLRINTRFTLIVAQYSKSGVLMDHNGGEIQCRVCFCGSFGILPLGLLKPFFLMPGLGLFVHVLTVLILGL